MQRIEAIDVCALAISERGCKLTLGSLSITQTDFRGILKDKK